MRDEWRAGDVQHCLGHLFGQFAEPRRKASGEQCKGRHVGHAACAIRSRLDKRCTSDNRLRPLKVEAEADFLEARHRHGMAQTRLVFGIEHQKAPAARADELSAGRSVRHCVIVPIVDRLIGHSA